MIADFQFGRGAGLALFPDTTTFSLSSTRRLRYLYCNGERIATLRAKDGYFTLSMLGARRLYDHIKAPGRRVAVSSEAAPYVARGGNVFARHVISADSDIRAGEEVLVVDSEGRLIATGRAVLAPEEMMQIRRGHAVSVRYGIDE